MQQLRVRKIIRPNLNDPTDSLFIQRQKRTFQFDKYKLQNDPGATLGRTKSHHLFNSITDAKSVDQVS